MNKPDKLNLKQWALEDRPREKMKQKGASALTNAELLAILIHTGNTEDSVVALTQKVMASCRNSLSELGKLSVGELCSFKGIGEAKAITILAACELGRRRKEEKPLQVPVIRTSRDIYDWFYPVMADKQVEECHVLLLNQAGKVLRSMLVSQGGLTSAFSMTARASALRSNRFSKSFSPTAEPKRGIPFPVNEFLNYRNSVTVLL